MRLSHTWRRGRDRQNRARRDTPEDRSIEDSKGYGGGDKDEKHEPHHCVHDTAAIVANSAQRSSQRLEVSQDPVRPG
ncbi:hypothetical protein LTS09_009140 [Friedmanniomyces endolithicus]|nr:hypothetical protein LTS09_009140 [Friedmanniomyces endolithicus]